MIVYLAYRLAGILLPLLPAPIGYALAWGLGGLVCRVARRGRQAVMSNLARVLGPQAPPEAVRRLSRQAFQNQFKNYFDLFRLPSLRKPEVESLIRLEGYQHLERALSKGRGAIVVTAHFGSLDVVAQILTAKGLKVTVPAEHLRPERLFCYVCRLRASMGIRLIPVDGPLIGLVKALKRNEVVGLLADRDVADSGTVVDFFGAPARLPSGHVQLALRTGAPIVVGYTLRLADNSYLARIFPPVELEGDGADEERVKEGMRKVLERVEGFIRENPGQWVMFRPVWEDPRAPGEAKKEGQGGG